MKPWKIILVVFIAIVATALAYGTSLIAFAHGDQQHVVGTVTALAGDSITVKTRTKDHIVVYTMPDTRYEKSGAVASMKDLKIGDRIVIHAGKMNDKLMATEVRFGPAAHACPIADKGVSNSFTRSLPPNRGARHRECHDGKGIPSGARVPDSKSRECPQSLGQGRRRRLPMSRRD